MNRTFLIRAARRTRTAKFFAACLILLGITPFTAPFSTFDVADIFGETPLHSLATSEVKAVKTLKDLTDLSFLVVAYIPTFGAAAIVTPAFVSAVDSRSLRSLVLRI